MDCTVKNLEKTFDLKQKAMVNKLHNMQWLKNRSHSSNSEKLKTIYKHIQDHNENNKLKDEGLLTENIKTYSVKESDNYHLMDTYKNYLPVDAISENNDNMWNKDANSSNTFPNSTKLVKVKDEDKKDILMITKSILTTKLDVQSCTDKMPKNQSDMLQNNENITQNAVYSNVTNFETRSNKTTDLTNQDKNINKNEVLQIMQQPVFKQSVSKMPKSVKKIPSNYGVYKNKTLEKSEKKSSVSKNSDLLLYESEKRNKKIVDDKHSLHHQKVNLDFNFKRDTKFVMQYKNSTLTEPAQNKDTLRNIECTSNGKNSSYNNSRFNNGYVDNTERKDVIKREYISSSVFSNSNVRIEGLCTKKDHTSQKNKLNHMQSTTDTKSTIIYKKGICNSEKNVNFAKTHLTEKEYANLNIDIRRQEPILEQCHKEMKRIDKSKSNIDQQNIEINNITENEQNLSKDSSNLFPNKCTMKIPANVIHQHSLQFEDTQYMDDVKKLEGNQTTCNNSLETNTIQKNVTIVNSQQSIQNIRCDMQQAIITQAKDQIKQMPSWGLNDSKFYNQNFSVRNAMRPSQVSNTFNVTSLCGSNMQTSNDGNATSILGTAINHNKENSNVFYKHMPNIQQKSDTFSTFTDHSILLDQTKCNSSVQDGFHVESYNIVQPTTIYNSDALDPDDIKNTRLSHPIIYAPSLNMQTRNPQLQYPLPVFYNSSCANYVRTIPNMINQLNNFNCIYSLHDQHLKYIPRMQMNNYVRANDLNNHTIHPRNIIDNVSMKFNQHYEKCQDNSQRVCDLFRYVAPLPHSGSRQNVNFMPMTNINQYNNAYFWQNQERNQNAVNYMQILKCPKNQTTQDFPCDDNESENIPPIISPKEFVTNNVKFSNNIG
ncbi:uncharacterized protein LOC105256898 isoform X2 [Camponotus floridanus]|nr:uncharacterized protein LOC105256898 isoform X2 [Camponotus floridanus]